ncbi:hypothetical protein TWF730_005402 [Orbilia blumenaviensis]|uniref:Uncharacterized protein n=1 Tax=Orbilia blumenaviensis TaxID=1796055 RepID=A0AAV9VJG2_9PEZI
MMAAHGVPSSLSSGGHASPRKGPKSPPMTDEDREEEERDENSQGDIRVEGEVANTSKKRKRAEGGRRQPAPRKRAGKKAKLDTAAAGMHGGKSMKEEGIEEEE